MLAFSAFVLSISSWMIYPHWQCVLAIVLAHMAWNRGQKDEMTVAALFISYAALLLRIKAVLVGTGSLEPEIVWYVPSMLSSIGPFLGIL